MNSVKFFTYSTMYFPPMRGVTKTLHPFAATPAYLSNFLIHFGPPAKIFAQPCIKGAFLESQMAKPSPSFIVGQSIGCLVRRPLREEQLEVCPIKNGLRFHYLFTSYAKKCIRL